VVGNATTLLRRQAPNGTFTPFSAWLLRQMTLRNRGNQDAALGAGELLQDPCRIHLNEDRQTELLDRTMRLVTDKLSRKFSAGVMGAANAILASNATSWGRLEAVLLLTELMRGNSDAKDEALAEGERSLLCGTGGGARVCAKNC
jgi:hypothetical protein